MGLRQMITAFAAVLLTVAANAQEIPLMKADKSVISGVLPNGMSYYLVSNPSDKGVADFALVQKAGRLNLPDSSGIQGHEVVSVAREALASLSRLEGQVPQDFLTIHGASAGPEGYVSVSDDATVFRFRNVRLSDGKEVLDSTLLLVMDIVDKKCYSPADQAVVVSGDIAAQDLAVKLRMMSYMIPSVRPGQKKELVDEDSENLRFVCENSDDDLGTVTLEWSSKRVPREYMVTVQPVIFDMSLDMLGRIAARRARVALAAEKIPVADVSYKRLASNSTPYDDRFSVSVTAERAYAADVLAILTDAMASIDAAGALPGEYMLAEAEFLSAVKKQAHRTAYSNEEYVDRCVSAFLYNSSLASPKEIYDFHKSRKLQDSFKIDLFNSIVSALLQPSASLEVRTPLDADQSRKIFESAWKVATAEAEFSPRVGRRADSSAFPGPGIKMKVKSSKQDPLSGGTVWTFPNGVKVIYKQMPSAGEMYYSLALNGGYSNIQGLRKGEGAFVSDVLKVCRVSGMRYSDFQDVLKKERVTMEPRVTLSNTLIRGQFPKDRLHFMLRAMLALANEREAMPEAYPYFRDCEELALDYAQGSYRSRVTAIDSIMCPDYDFSPYKSSGRLTDGFHAKADAFFTDQMGKMNDGVFVLVGDMDAESLKKTLMNFAGSFSTRDVAVRRPVLKYQPVSGWTTYTLPGEANSVDVAMSVRMPMTAANYMASSLAVMVLERELKQKLGGLGMRVDVSFDHRMYPEERLNVMVTLSEACADGFAAGVEVITPIEALSLVRGTLSEMSSIVIEKDAFKADKEHLKNDIALRMKDPMYWLDAITLRYLEGKDLMTGYEARIGAMTEAKVKEVLGLLDTGCKIEYVITK